jgi:3-oxoadipate enol-lactonase
MPIQSVDGTNLYYHEAGKGLPVVLVHGFPLDHRIWQAQVHDLSAVCRVITPDMRGFGKSTGGGSFTIPSLADDLYMLLSQIHALPCVLGGLSMGGYVALAYERQYASTLRGLMIIDARAAADDANARAGREVMIELARTQGSPAIAEKMMPKMLALGGAQAHPQVAAELKSIMEACPAQTIEYALAAMRDRPDSTPTLARIAAPTLIIVGDGDVLVPPVEAQQMHKAIRGSTISVIPGAGHISPMEQPHPVSRAIKHFLSSLSSS